MSQDEGKGSGSKEDEVPSSSGSTCRICQKSFAHRSSLSRHKKVHESSQPKIACHKCGKIFKRKDFLKMHNNRVKSCDKPKPSSWECCSHTFKSFSSYRRHARTHHSDISNKNHDNNNNCTNNNRDNYDSDESITFDRSNITAIPDFSDDEDGEMNIDNFVSESPVQNRCDITLLVDSLIKPEFLDF